MSNTNITQPKLMNFNDTSTSAIKLFPVVWKALEGLTALDNTERHEALDKLLELQAPRLSPLVAYVIATRIGDSDISLRFRIVQALGDILTPDDDGKLAPEQVGIHLKGYLSQMRTRPIFSLLQVADQYLEAEPHVVKILNTCSFAGRSLSDILADRRAPLAIRKQAIKFVGLVGFLDVIPSLKRLASRIETRLDGQKAMPFAYKLKSRSDEVTLLSDIHETLLVLEES